MRVPEGETTISRNNLKSWRFEESFGKCFLGAGRVGGAFGGFRELVFGRFGGVWEILWEVFGEVIG